MSKQQIKSIVSNITKDLIGVEDPDVILRILDKARTDVIATKKDFKSEVFDIVDSFGAEILQRCFAVDVSEIGGILGLIIMNTKQDLPLYAKTLEEYMVERSITMLAKCNIASLLMLNFIFINRMNGNEPFDYVPYCLFTSLGNDGITNFGIEICYANFFSATGELNMMQFYDRFLINTIIKQASDAYLLKKSSHTNMREILQMSTNIQRNVAYTTPKLTNSYDKFHNMLMSLMYVLVYG